MYQKGVYYSSIKIYNKIPDVIAELVSNKKCFLIQLKKYLIDQACYSLQEYLRLNTDSWGEAWYMLFTYKY